MKPLLKTIQTWAFSFLLLALFYIAITILANCSFGQAVTIAKGGVYGGYRIYWTDANAPAIFVKTTKPVTIQACDIWTTRTAVSNVCGNKYAIGANVEIKNCTFHFVGQNYPIAVGGTSPLVYLFQPQSVSVTESTFFGQGQGYGQGAGGVLIQGSGTPANTWGNIMGGIFEDCSPAIQLAGVRENGPNVWWIQYNQVVGDGRVALNDQISIYNSCGTPGHLLQVVNNLISANTDALQVPLSSGYSIGDWNSSYINAQGNYGLNVGGGSYYTNDNESTFSNNIIVGAGSPATWSCGIGVVVGAAVAENNQVAWFDNYYHMARDYYPALDTSNISLPQSCISRTYETQLYWQWMQSVIAAGIPVGAAAYSNPGISFSVNLPQ